MISASPGKSLPLGTSYTPHGVQFAIFSRHAQAVYLQLYENANDARPAHEIKLGDQNRTGDIWHILLHNVRPGQLYLYRVEGPWEPEQGHRFCGGLPLLDPYAKEFAYPSRWDMQNRRAYLAGHPQQLGSPLDAAGMPKCVVIDNDDFDWQADRPLNRPLKDTVIYETHVRGMSAHASSGAKYPGSYLGAIEMIPYYQHLGITSLELLPVQEFDSQENVRVNPASGERLSNYWGYSTLGFFAPKAGYASGRKAGDVVREFKTMVREYHRAGIEIILDVVYNHTGEGNELGPTLSFRGLDNSIYYMLDDDLRLYKNYSGCGNTLNCNHPVVRTMILDSLHYWVTEMHIDGFRFDLGSILGRDQRGNLMENPPVLEHIAEDPVLRNTKVIAEAWDAAGAYQVGMFPGGRWAEWNDRFRDDVRRFWRGDAGSVPDMATRMTGSSDLYLDDGRKPFHSINFVTSHDGFTLRDLVSYNAKHNTMNGEENRDGSNANLSFNHGVEGPTAQTAVNRLRLRQQKNYIASLLLSIGTPMLLGGDELGRTQQGNNNAYCQDNEISYTDYSLRSEYAGLFEFARQLIAFRLQHPAFLRSDFFTGASVDGAVPDISWFNAQGQEYCWEKPGECLVFRFSGPAPEPPKRTPESEHRQACAHYCIMLNPSRRKADCRLPDLPGNCAASSKWTLVLDTAIEDGGIGGSGFFAPDSGPSLGKLYPVSGKSMVLVSAALP